LIKLARVAVSFQRANLQIREKTIEQQYYYKVAQPYYYYKKYYKKVYFYNLKIIIWHIAFTNSAGFTFYSILNLRCNKYAF